MSEKVQSYYEVAESVVDLICMSQIGYTDNEALHADQVEALLEFREPRHVLRAGLALLIRDGILESKPRVGFWLSIVPETASQDAEGVIKVRHELEKNLLSSVVNDPRIQSHPLFGYEESIEKLGQDLIELERHQTDSITGFLKAEARYRTSIPRDFWFPSAYQTTFGWSNVLRVINSLYLIPTEEDCRELASSHRSVFENLRERNLSGVLSSLDNQEQRLLEIVRR